MRNSMFLRGATLFIAAVSPAFVCAQFQQPTDEELKMTADPKAPGADAVYLEVREVCNDEFHFRSHYARIKVLTEKGKELASIQLPYVKHSHTITDFRGRSIADATITDIKGRTIHADGTVVPLDVKPEDLLHEKSGDFQVNSKVFTLPSVEVGSVLEYTWTLRYDTSTFNSPEWEIQKLYFVHKAHYEFLPFVAFLPGSLTRRHLVDQDGDAQDSLLWRSLLPRGATVQQAPATGLFSLDLTDIPAAPDEAWMPPMRSTLYRVDFYYKDSLDAGHWWMEAGKRWTKRVNRFADPKPLEDAVAKIVAPGDSDLDKAQKLYKAVQALDNTAFSRVKTESERKELDLNEQKRAEDTWAQKSGSSRDIALLYLAMLRAAGLKAYALTVVDRSKRLFDPNYMSLSQLTENLVILKAGDKEIALDPGEKMCPFGTLSWKHAASSGLREDDQGVGVTTTPNSAYTANTVTRAGDFTLDSHGGISGRLQMIFTGQGALYWRQKSIENDESELKKRFDKELESEVPEGIGAHVDHFLGMDDPDSNLMAFVNVSGTLGAVTSKRILLPGYFFETRSRVPFVNEEKRETPVDMRYGDRVTDQITYHLPDGVAVEGAPQDADFSWAGHERYVGQSKTGPGQITIERSISRAFTFAKPEEYQDLRAFYQKVAATDHEELVLTTAPAAPAAVPAAQTAPAAPGAPVTPAAPAGKGN